MNDLPITKAELARELGVSRTYITLLSQGKRKPSQQLANKLRQIMLTYALPREFAFTHIMGKGGLEPPRLSAHDPKSCPSASSGTPPYLRSVNILAYYSLFYLIVN